MTSTLLRLASVAIIGAALWSLAAGAPAETSYYPLRQGMTWQYEVSNPNSEAEPLLLRVTNVGRRRIGTWSATAQRMEVAGTSAGYRFAAEQADSIVTVGEQRPGQEEPMVIDPPILLLRLPADVGQSWSSEATTTIIQPGTKVPMTVRIESVTDAVQGPAGEFRSCLRVSSVGKVEVEQPDLGGTAEVELHNTLWYAPGVGVVQIARRESSNRPELGESEIRYRLISRGS